MVDLKSLEQLLENRKKYSKTVKDLKEAEIEKNDKNKKK